MRPTFFYGVFQFKTAFQAYSLVMEINFHTRQFFMRRDGEQRGLFLPVTTTLTLLNLLL